ncbi:hypothetical protein KIL84_017718 [Mauremys mutica]|uniref:Uncharacterized protein n=1 Tax=Mauremys mutica TaxID=74926 RepID=A0A9D4AXR9_9SAUR|nr:hypothetical protein KIL84_017718 [Mauremys mutica]
MMHLVSSEDTCDVLNEAHMTTGHVRHDEMSEELMNKLYISQGSLEVVKFLCIAFQHKCNQQSTSMVLFSQDYSSHGHIYLIAVKSIPGDSYKWIMICQVHPIKDFILLPQSSRSAARSAIPVASYLSTVR